MAFLLCKSDEGIDSIPRTSEYDHWLVMQVDDVTGDLSRLGIHWHCGRQKKIFFHIFKRIMATSCKTVLASRVSASFR